MSELLLELGVDLEDLFANAVETADRSRKAILASGRLGAKLSSAITAPLAALAAPVLAAARAHEDALAALRRTGATGSLDGLVAIYDQVRADAPIGAEEAARAVGVLSQRLGLTGDALKDLTSQVVNLADVAGTDLAETTDAAVRVFAAWDVPANDRAKDLDLLWKITQKSGVSLHVLTRELTANAPVLKQCGMSFKEAALLVGALARGGVPITAAMRALTRGVVKAGKDYEDEADIEEDRAEDERKAYDEMQRAADASERAQRKAAGAALDAQIAGLDYEAARNALQNANADEEYAARAVTANQTALMAAMREREMSLRALNAVSASRPVDLGLVEAARSRYEAACERVNASQESLMEAQRESTRAHEAAAKAAADVKRRQVEAQEAVAKQLAAEREEAVAVAAASKVAADRAATVKQFEKVRDSAQPASDRMREVLERIKQAPDATAAAAIAVAEFGPEGNQIVDAIRSGRVDVDGLTRAVEASDETINKADDDTEDMAERFGKLRSAVETALRPLGQSLVRAAKSLQPMLEQVLSMVARASAWFQSLTPELQRTVLGALALAAAIGPLLMVFGLIISSAAAIGGVLVKFGRAGRLLLVALERVALLFGRLVVGPIIGALQGLATAVLTCGGVIPLVASQIVFNVVGVAAVIAYVGHNWESMVPLAYAVTLDIFRATDALSDVLVKLGGRFLAALVRGIERVLLGVLKMMSRMLEAIGHGIAWAAEQPLKIMRAAIEAWTRWLKSGADEDLVAAPVVQRLRPIARSWSQIFAKGPETVALFVEKTIAAPGDPRQRDRGADEHDSITALNGNVLQAAFEWAMAMANGGWGRRSSYAIGDPRFGHSFADVFEYAGTRSDMRGAVTGSKLATLEWFGLAAAGAYLTSPSLAPAPVGALPTPAPVPVDPVSAAFEPAPDGETVNVDITEDDVANGVITGDELADRIADVVIEAMA